jgi:hypothetical protein
MQAIGPDWITVGVLPDRVAPVVETHPAEISEVDQDADVKKDRVEIAVAERQLVVLRGCLAHPFPQRVAQFGEDEQRRKDQQKQREKRQHVFPHAADKDIPARVADIMEQDPEERAQCDGEKDVKAQKPRIGELSGIHECANDGKDAANDRRDRQYAAQPKPGRHDPFRRRQPEDVGMRAHCTGWGWI